jgi:hypothetical protein
LTSSPSDLHEAVAHRVVDASALQIGLHGVEEGLVRPSVVERRALGERWPIAADEPSKEAHGPFLARPAARDPRRRPARALPGP